MSNAIKFTNKGKSIYVSIEFTSTMLSVSVKDEGIGIPKDKIDKIFDVFNQGDESTTRRYGGAGLGLAISKDLIRLLGGELKVESTEGEGSVFYFSIPVEIGKAIQKVTELTENVAYEGQKILIAEDNSTNQLLIGILMQKMGIQYDMTNNGLEAVEAYKLHRYDAILMDENMPEMNGMEATKEILAYEKVNNLPHTPIIALTANALKGDREKFLAAGMDEYVTKPISKDKLIQVLKAFISI